MATKHYRKKIQNNNIVGYIYHFKSNLSSSSIQDIFCKIHLAKRSSQTFIVVTNYHEVLMDSFLWFCSDPWKMCSYIQTNWNKNINLKYYLRILSISIWSMLLHNSDFGHDLEQSYLEVCSTINCQIFLQKIRLKMRCQTLHFYFSFIFTGMQIIFPSWIWFMSCSKQIFFQILLFSFLPNA